jgi:DNA-directed RNA polymerase specialized sigma24 family protein
MVRSKSDLAAFEDFYRREFPRLAGSLHLACGSRDLAEELTQETFTRALNHWNRVAQMERPSGWIYRTGFNLLRRDWRLRGRTYPLPTPTAPPGDATDRTDLVRALATLPYEQASAVVLRHVLDYSTEDAAATLEMQPGAFRMMLSRALKTLRLNTNLVLPEEESP